MLFSLEHLSTRFTENFVRRCGVLRKRIAEAALLSTLLTGFLLPGLVYGDCVDYRDFVRRVGGTVNPTPSWGVAIHGNFAYVTDWTYPSSGFTVINVLNPSSPYVVNRVNLSAPTYGLVVSGSTLYVANRELGLKIFDLSDPMFPSLVGTAPIPGVAYDVAVSGTHAYVADLTKYLRVIDISNPVSPTLVGSVATPGSAVEVEVSGSYAYVADDQSGLQVIDVSNPSSPGIVGSTSTPMAAYGVALSGSYALVADHKFGLRVIDVTNPASPILAASVSTPGPQNGGPYGIAVSGSFAYVSDDFRGLLVFDISNPILPDVVGSVYIPNAYQRGRKVTVDGTHAYVAASGFHVVDISNPRSPFLGDVNASYFKDVAVLGAYAYATDYYSGLKIIDISNPSLPTIVGSVFTANSLGVAVSGSRAYVTDAGALRAIDVSNPASPFMTGSTGVSGGAGIALSGAYAYVACSAGLQVIDISNPSPHTVATVSVPDFPCYYVVISGSYAYVTGWNQNTGFRVIDITNPISPAIVGGLTFSSGRWLGVAVAGSFAYVAGSSGLQVIDVSSPPAPAIVGTLNLGGSADVAVSGSYAYVTNSSGIQVIDIRSPVSPSIVATMDLPGEANALTASDSYLFATNLTSSIFISPLFCVGPCLPHLSHPNGGETYLTGMRTTVSWENPTLDRCAVSYAQLYYSPDGGGTWNLAADHVLGTEYVWGVPELPSQNGRLRVVVLDDSGVIGDDSSDGSFVIESPTGVEDMVPATYRLYQNSPNPFASATRTAFDLPVGSRVKLEIFDLSGREIRVLSDSWYPAGSHEVAWDARDASGHLVAGGIYFLRMEAGGFADTKRMYLSN
jgi:hypothetical protein